MGMRGPAQYAYRTAGSGAGRACHSHSSPFEHSHCKMSRAGGGHRGSVAEGIELGLHQVEPAQEIDKLRPRELRADVAGRVGAGGAGRCLEAEAEEGDGVGGAGEVAAGHLDVCGPVDRLEQRRPAQRGAAELAARHTGIGQGGLAAGEG